MSYQRTGQGPPLVLVHGYVGDGRSTWRPQINGLAEDFDVIALDLPGAGDSDDPPEDFGMRGFADSVAGFLASLDLSSPHLVGLSFGGATIIEFCRTHQDSIATITLAGAYAGWAGSLAPAQVDHRLNQALELSQLEPAKLVDALLPTMFADGAPPDVIVGYERSLVSFHPIGLRAMAYACTEDLTDVLQTIRLPTLLIYGENDTRAPEGVAEDLHRAIPQSELVKLVGAGHVCNVDAAGAFNQTLRRFLQEHALE